MMKSYCAIGCNNQTLKGSAISFYRFPTDQERWSKWISAVNRETGSLRNTVGSVRHILSMEKVTIHFVQTMPRASSTMSVVLSNERGHRLLKITTGGNDQLLHKSRSHNEDGSSELLAGAPNRQRYKSLNFLRGCPCWQIDSEWASYYHQCWKTDCNNNELHQQFRRRAC